MIYLGLTLAFLIILVAVQHKVFNYLRKKVSKTDDDLKYELYKQLEEQAKTWESTQNKILPTYVLKVVLKNKQTCYSEEMVAYAYRDYSSTYKRTALQRAQDRAKELLAYDVAQINNKFFVPKARIKSIEIVEFKKRLVK